uniref:Uncharacterized protein n=1 Tax=Seriola lalandi dorsalis TaxID=1841481 RepID=A0A3B4YFH3_SERLL
LMQEIAVHSAAFLITHNGSICPHDSCFSSISCHFLANPFNVLKHVSMNANEALSRSTLLGSETALERNLSLSLSARVCVCACVLLVCIVFTVSVFVLISKTVRKKDTSKVYTL